MPSIALAVEKRLDAESWNDMYVNPERGVRYGQLRRKFGNRVNIPYMKVKTTTQPRVEKATVLLMGRRNSMRPATKRKTEEGRRMGIASTACDSRNTSTPSYMYARIRACFRGAPRWCA